MSDGLSCSCDDDSEWHYTTPPDYSILNTKRSRKCYSCDSKITVGETVAKFYRHRRPLNDIEERIYVDEVPMSTKYFCEACADIFFNLDELGFCITLGSGDSMQELLKQYQEVYSAKAQRSTSSPDQTQ